MTQAVLDGVIGALHGLTEPNPFWGEEDEDEDSLNAWDGDWWVDRDRDMSQSLVNIIGGEQREREKRGAGGAGVNMPGWSDFQQVGPQRKGVSPERWMRVYNNGRIPLQAMTRVLDGNRTQWYNGGFWLRPDAGASFLAMKKAMRAAGVPVTLHSAYRSFEHQVQLHRQNPYDGNSGAAAPGSSDHGWGLAIDAANERMIQWLMAHGDEYGWQQHHAAGERHHFEYKGGFQGAYRTQTGRRKPKRATMTIRNQPAPISAVPAMLGGDPNTFADVLSGLLGPQAKPTVQRRRVTLDGALQVPRGPQGPLPGFVPRKYATFFARAGERTGVDPRLLAFVARLESGFNPLAISSAGAAGIMQLMPFNREGINWKDPWQNILRGASILAGYIRRAKGSLRLGLAFYNAGPGNFTAGLDYADRILKEYNG